MPHLPPKGALPHHGADEDSTRSVAPPEENTTRSVVVPKARAILPPRALIGMVHVDALPGAPFSRWPLGEIVSRAVAEARVIADAGFDAIIIENMHDRPYVLAPHGPEVVAAMTLVALAVRGVLPEMPMGVQVLSAGEREAMAVALAAGLRFIRCENFSFAHVADEGLLATAAAGPLLRYRRAIGAEHIAVMCDVKKKHASHAITADVTIGDAAHSAELFGADGVIVSGAFTGQPTSAADVAAVKSACGLPVWVGSGVTPGQVPELFEHADALIVGSYIKKDGLWSGVVDEGRCREIVAARGAVRQTIR